MAKPTEALQRGDALLIVDVQNDFCPGGALPIAEGHDVVPVLNRWVAAAGEKGVPVYASRDWHPVGHLSFDESGGQWPPHCIQDTQGADYHPDLALPGDAIQIIKGTRFDQDQYSAFHHTGLGEHLKKQGIKRLWVGGLAEDVCVRATVLDAREHGFDVRVIKDATRPVTPEGGERARREMEEAGAVLEMTE